MIPECSKNDAEEFAFSLFQLWPCGQVRNLIVTLAYAFLPKEGKGNCCYAPMYNLELLCQIFWLAYSHGELRVINMESRHKGLPY